jgi:hypothetical protein
MAFIGYSCIRAKPLLTTDAALWLGDHPADADKIGHFSRGIRDRHSGSLISRETSKVDGPISPPWPL